MENPEEILHSLEEFSKTKPKDIPRELEEYLCFVAKTGDPVYQWSAVKSLFREKMISVITEFYETCPTVEIPPCPNVDIFNYDVMKNFILEKLDTFAAAPFTLQRICELLTTPRKEYNRIDKYMRALEKNILVVSTTEPGGRRATENGESIMNGIESDHLPETSNSSNDINVEEMDDAPAWPRLLQNDTVPYQNDTNNSNEVQNEQSVQETVVTASKTPDVACTSSQDTVITSRSSEEPYVSIEPVPSNTCARQESNDESDVSVTITAIPAGVQKRRNSVEPVVSSESTEEITESCDNSSKSSDVAKDAEVKPDDETSSSSQQEDADSSSSVEEDKEETKEEKSEVEVEVLPDDAASQNELSSTENEESKDSIPDSEVDTTEPGQPNEEKSEEVKDEIEGSEQIVDTTKCSSPPPETSEDLEITSSDKIEEVHSSQDDVREDNEATTSEAREESQTEEKVDVCEKEESSTTPMEVDDDYSNSEKVDEVVRAEATSDSPL